MATQLPANREKYREFIQNAAIHGTTPCVITPQIEFLISNSLRTITGNFPRRIRDGTPAKQGSVLKLRGAKAKGLLCSPTTGRRRLLQHKVAEISLRAG